MTRNTERRVEVACPVLDPEVRKRVFHIIDVLTSDNVKARQLGPDGEWHARKVGSAPCCSQEVFQEEAIQEEQVHPRAPRQTQEGQGVPLEAAVRPEKLTVKAKMGGPNRGRPFILSKNLCRDESAQVGAGELEGAAARLEWDRMP